MAVIDRGGHLHFKVQIKGKQYRFPVRDFVVPRLKPGQRMPTSIREAERRWEGELEACVLRGENPRQPPVRTPGSSALTIAEFIEQVYTPTMQRERRRHDIRNSNLRVLMPIIGHLPLQTLETSTPSDLVKDAYPITGDDAYAVGTRHKLLRRVGHVTTIAIQKRYLSAASPFRTGEVKVSQSEEMVRTRRLHEGEEERLLTAALTYDQSGTGNRKLTAEIVEEIRRRVAAGEKQTDVASDFKISGGLCSQIVNRVIWNPRTVAGTGQAFHDLLIGALDTGARQGQLLKIQNHYVDWKTHQLHLPASEDKCLRARDISFDPEGRLATIFQKRRFVGGPNGFVFGTATGAYQAFPRKVWENVVLLAHGHKVDRPKGRRGQLSAECQAWFAHIDLHWHDLRREFGSLLYEHSNGNVFFVMQALGHTSLKTTQKYLHLGEHGFDEAFRQVFAVRRGTKSRTKVTQKRLTKKRAVG